MNYNFNRLWSGFSKNAEKDLEKANKEKERIAALSPVENEDALVIDFRNIFGALGGYGAGMGLFGTDIEQEEIDAIESYRALSERPEVSAAIAEITNEAVTADYTDFPVSIVFNDEEKDSKLKEATRKVILEEFEEILKILKFNETAPERFRQWYIDGKCYYHAVLDPDNPKKGIIDIRQIDPRHIKKIIETEEVLEDGVSLRKVKNVYYRYSSYIGTKEGQTSWENAIQNQMVAIHPDAIAYANSGLFREGRDGNIMAISHLEKAIRPSNQLNLLEDALVIYRLARAPERRVFNIDVGSLPKVKAEQYISSLIAKYRSKMVYNSEKGTVDDQRNLMSMLEDFWLPKREGRGTEITTLASGQGLGQIEDVEYFRKKLYDSLNIPVSRLNSEAQFVLGRSGEITREEVKFSKFILMLRAKFSKFLLKLLEIQLVNKNILTAQEFRDNENLISFQWANDMHWKELADAEMLNNRLALLSTMENYIGKYYTDEWVMKNVLKLTADEIEAAKELQKKNNENPEDRGDDEEGVDRPYAVYQPNVTK